MPIEIVCCKKHSQLYAPFTIVPMYTLLFMLLLCSVNCIYIEIILWIIIATMIWLRIHDDWRLESDDPIGWLESKYWSTIEKGKNSRNFLGLIPPKYIKQAAAVYYVFKRTSSKRGNCNHNIKCSNEIFQQDSAHRTSCHIRTLSGRR